MPPNAGIPELFRCQTLFPQYDSKLRAIFACYLLSILRKRFLSLHRETQATLLVYEDAALSPRKIYARAIGWSPKNGFSCSQSSNSDRRGGAAHEKSPANYRKQNKKLLKSLISGAFGTPWGIRTPGLLVRSQTLYPAELTARALQIFSYNSILLYKWYAVRDSNPRPSGP